MYSDDDLRDKRLRYLRDNKPPDEEPKDAPTLYQGHRGPGIGRLAAEIPDRIDGDKDTVAAERRPRRSDKSRISPEPVPPHLQAKVIDDLKRLQLRTFAQVAYTGEEKKRVTHLLREEREAVRSGEDRQPYIAEREGITAVARKRGQKQPSAESKAFASRLQREKSHRSGGGPNRKKAVKESGLFSLPNVVVRTA